MHRERGELSLRNHIAEVYFDELLKVAVTPVRLSRTVRAGMWRAHDSRASEGQDHCVPRARASAPGGHY